MEKHSKETRDKVSTPASALVRPSQCSSSSQTKGSSRPVLPPQLQRDKGSSGLVLRGKDLPARDLIREVLSGYGRGCRQARVPFQVKDPPPGGFTLIGRGLLLWKWKLLSELSEGAGLAYLHTCLLLFKGPPGEVNSQAFLAVCVGGELQWPKGRPPKRNLRSGCEK